MLRKSRGFTIVEVVLIIVVLGILVGIVTVAWGNLVPSSRDRTREGDVRAWTTTFDLYKSRFSVWPVLPSNDLTPKSVCLGQPALGDSAGTLLTKCVQYTTATAYTAATGGTYSSAITTDPDPTSLATEVKKVGKSPVNTGPAVKGILAGPFVYLWSVTTGGTNVTVYAQFINFFETACPTGYTRITTAPAAVLPLPNSSVTPTMPSPPANYTTLFTSLPAIPSSIYVCYLPKVLTYSTAP